MHSESDNIEIMILIQVEDFDSLKNRYQSNVENMRGSEFPFYYVQILCYNCHEVSLNRGGSYIDSPDWIKTKVQQ